MDRVLIAPSVWNLTNRRYGKTFNILQYLPEGGFHVDLYVGNAIDRPSHPDVAVHEVGSGSKLSYYSRSFRAAWDEVGAGRVDLYHHMNLDYRWFNPVVMSGRTANTPVVIGPAQAGHDIEPRDFDDILKRATGRELPSSLTRPAYHVIDPLTRDVLNPVRRMLFERTLQGADRIVVVHKEARQVYERLIPSEKIEVIPLGVNPEFFEFTERDLTREVVAVGTLKARKGYDVLLDAFAETTSEIPDARLHIFGEGPLESQLKAQADRLGVDDAVTFHGFVDQSKIQDYFKRAQLFVHPSYSESFSPVRLEAMASGCPVIVSDIPGASEMVTDGEEGFVVPPGESSAFATRMIELLSDDDLTRELGHNARNKVEMRYDWREISQRYADLWTELT